MKAKFMDRPASPLKKPQHKQSIDSEKAESDKGGEIGEKPEEEKKVFRPKGVGKSF